YMTRALKIYEEFGDEPRQALVLGNIGNLYLDYNKFEPAKQAFERTIVLAKKHNISGTLANAYSGMLQYNFQTANYPMAMRYARMAETILSKSNSRSDLGTVYNSIGQIFYEQKKYDEAMDYYDRSLAIRKDMNDQLGIASCYKNIGVCYGKLQEFDKANSYLNRAIAVFKRIDARDYLRDAHVQQAKLFEEQKNLGGSLLALKESTKIKDSIYSRETTDRINELEIQYQTEKKAQQIVLLNKENKIQKLTVQNRNITIGIVAGVLLLSVLGGFMFYNRYKLRQENRLQETIIKQQDLSTKAVLQAEETERQRISSELHDGLGQMFSAVKLNLSGIIDDIKFKNDQSSSVFMKTLDLVDESCKEVRVISHQMAPNVLLRSGLATAVRDFIDKIDARKLEVKLETVGLKDRLDTNVESVLYRVIQEIVNNVIKHAGANKLDIQLIREEDGVNIMIEDNGKGFDTAIVERAEGMGLKNIRSRISYLKGSVDFSSAPGKGTLVAIYVPL
ncbi:MAG: tetratricopeptide repeat protein, partial [Chitinophagaceae bacterium]